MYAVLKNGFPFCKPHRGVNFTIDMSYYITAEFVNGV